MLSLVGWVLFCLLVVGIASFWAILKGNCVVGIKHRGATSREGWPRQAKTTITQWHTTASATVFYQGKTVVLWVLPPMAPLKQA